MIKWFQNIEIIETTLEWKIFYESREWNEKIYFSSICISMHSEYVSICMCAYVVEYYIGLKEGKGGRDKRWKGNKLCENGKCCSHCGINNKAKNVRNNPRKKKSFTCWQNNNKPTTNVYVGDCTKYKYFSAHGTRLSNINVST